jgi:hypothetical protein
VGALPDNLGDAAKAEPEPGAGTAATTTGSVFAEG